MKHFPYFHFSHLRQHLNTVLLDASWIAGLLFGLLFISRCGDSVLPLMRRALAAPVSIVGYFTAMFLPLFLTFSVAAVGVPVIAAMYCFLKAALYSAAVFGCITAFGSCKWPAPFMILFSQAAIAPILFCFLSRSVLPGFRLHFYHAILLLIPAVITGFIYFRLVLPTAAMLIDS